MLERTSTKTLPLLNRAADLAPTAQACCGVCRTCTTTNIVGLGIAAITGATFARKRLVTGQPARTSS